MPPDSTRLLVDVLPGGRHLVDLVGPVVDEGGVRVLRRAPDLALVRGRLERGRDEALLDRLHVGREVVQPALRRELGGPDHVGAEDVAVRGLGLLALDELGALLVGRGRELDDLGLEALRLVLLVEAAAPLLGLARRVLAGAVRDGALGALHRVRRRSSWRSRSRRRLRRRLRRRWSRPRRHRIRRTPSPRSPRSVPGPCFSSDPPLSSRPAPYPRRQTPYHRTHLRGRGTAPTSAARSPATRTSPPPASVLPCPSRPPAPGRRPAR